MRSLLEIPETNDHQFFGGPTLWRVLKDEDGHFNKHVDYQYYSQHIGNQILIPPKSQNQYQGGNLINQQDDKTFHIKPDQLMWTYVFIPLGVKHQVEKVKGTRFSFVRRVYASDNFHYTKTPQIQELEEAHMID